MSITFEAWFERFREICLQDGWTEQAADSWDKDALKEIWYDNDECPEFAYHEEMAAL